MEQPLAQRCPEGVEFQQLQKVCDLQCGTSITQKDIIEL